MGISSTLYSGYSKQEIETNRIPTPFGDAIVSISGQPISLKMASLHKFIESELIP